VANISRESFPEQHDSNVPVRRMDKHDQQFFYPPYRQVTKYAVSVSLIKEIKVVFLIQAMKVALPSG
jgi:hypothetical protein